jgi:hypothetical protein
MPDQAPAGIPAPLHDAPPTQRLVWSAARRTDAATCEEIASVTGTHPHSVRTAARALHDRDALAPRNPAALGRGPPAVAWSAQYPCPECGEWFAVWGVKTHRTTIHDGVVSAGDLADADPEDLGLSPTDEPDVPGGMER